MGLFHSADSYFRPLIRIAGSFSESLLFQIRRQRHMMKFDAPECTASDYDTERRCIQLLAAKYPAFYGFEPLEL